MSPTPPRNPPRITHKDARVLDQLAVIIRQRSKAKAEDSYTARLLEGGRPQIVRKLLEEANETALAALLESKANLRRESADLLYNLLVLWYERGITPSEVWQTLAERDSSHDRNKVGVKIKTPPRKSSTAKQRRS
ncbi:MAG: phosphoribosyl-ATP diphosphatase [Alphaproteobacteria bacterium]